jgi:6-phosphogluconolactonase
MMYAVQMERTMTTRRTLFRNAAGLAAALVRGASAATAKQYLVYWGTYTSSESKGIYVSRFDSGTGKLSVPELAVESENPSYLAVHPTRRYLYAVNEIDMNGKTIGSVSAFRVDSRTGKLTPINRASTKGAMPCHLNIDKTGAVLAAVNWSTASTVSFPLRRDGSLGEAAAFHQHAGERSGVAPGGPPVQPHAHSVNFSPDNRFLVATDTGLNRVYVHRLDVGKAAFTAHDPPFLGLKHQANPRQLRFHPNGKWAYAANESGPGCTMLRYDGRRGAFEEGPTARTVPESYRERMTTAEIETHPSGRFVYVSNRGHNSIAVLKIDEASGAPTLVETFPLGGSTPRSFNIDPTGGYLIAMLQRSNLIVPLQIDSATGKLSRAGDDIALPIPVCAKFLELG